MSNATIDALATVVPVVPIPAPTVTVEQAPDQVDPAEVVPGQQTERDANDHRDERAHAYGVIGHHEGDRIDETAPR